MCLFLPNQSKKIFTSYQKQKYTHTPTNRLINDYKILSVPRDRVRDPRGGVEGVARAAHSHEDPPHLPVRVQGLRV